ncbi:DUF4145 domain-containing protein [Staphylococcus condimenti]|uniref:DUF4145 domain-containing protein n=1 Tax=Staphylococcus condimenti TaxID=70255 RepID=UPI0025514157|nr:DUF4145 domain-containing protein [Staphylococcus condimenti]MDK8646443.1 DUF4145 domain-containing protein [Staphylococcus condimenti]
MKRKIKLLTTYSQQYGSYDVELPNYCPWCKSNISPDILSQTPFDTSNKEWPFSLTLQCPNCHKHFLQTYKTKVSANDNLLELDIDNEKPMPENLFVYPSEIDEISKEFNNIITQSSNAEDLGYNHLAGIGYRKAIEFLVKDYLIEFKNEDRDSISSKPLNQCINSIDDERIKKLAKAATWIGNDETHYTKKHADKDIQHLKSFLHAFTSLVSLEIQISKANDFLNNN